MRSLSTLFCVLALASIASAQVFTQEDELVAQDPDSGDNFGISVAIQGDTAVVGGSHIDDNLGNAGGVEVFERNGITWSSTAQLFPSGQLTSDLFGFAVALDGDYIVAGAYSADPQGSASGNATVFVRSGNTWCELDTLVAEVAGVLDGEANAWFGHSVDISGDTIVVGAHNHHEGGQNDSGAVYVFVRDDGGTPDVCDDTWPWQAKLTPTASQADAEFGFDVAIDGDRILIGSPLEDAPLSNQGGAYLFERVGTNWSEVAHLVEPGGTASDEFGRSVALDGNTVAVGVPRDDANGTDSGAVMFFEEFGGFWAFDERLDAGMFGTTSDRYGSSIHFDGDTAVVAAPASTIAGSGSGVAYYHERSGGSWDHEPIWQLVACNGAAGDDFGTAVGISSSRVVVGAPDHAQTSSSGLAYVYEYVQDEFSLLGFGDGAGMATPCPCMNESTPQRDQGCVNSTGRGAHISPQGSTSVSADDLLIRACNLVPSAPGLLFAGPAAINGGFGIPFGDGLRVAGGGSGTTRRLGFQAPTIFGEATWGPGLIAAAGWSAGMTQHFQIWYRDPINSPCGNPFNTTNAIRAVLTP